METWAAAFILLGNQFSDMGLKGGEGVEAVLRNSFHRRKGKPIGELETNVEQLGFFDKLPEKAHSAQLLEGAIDQPQSDEHGIRRDAERLVARRRQRRSPGPSTAISPARPSSSRR